MDVGEFCDNVVFYSGAVFIHRNKHSGQYMFITNSCATKRGLLCNIKLICYLKFINVNEKVNKNIVIYM